MQTPFLSAVTFCAYLLLSLPLAPAQSNVNNTCPVNRVRQIPRNQSADLNVLVPNITFFRQLVNCTQPDNITGFCIDVFELALSRAYARNWTVHYDCFEFPEKSNLNYHDMIQRGINENYDAIVGDISTVAARLAIADFSQPYIESGIAALCLAVGQRHQSRWMFFAPFTVRMWVTSLGAFFLSGLVLCLLEYKNQEGFRTGGLVKRLQRACGFIGSSLILMERDQIRSSVAQLLMVSWVIFVVLLGSSYTAGLSSYLTAQKLSPKVKDMKSLLGSNDSIGIRKRGSIVEQYLVKKLQVNESRLKLLRRSSDVIESLNNGSVVALFEEVPYIHMLLSSLPHCHYQVVGSKLTTEGYGFAFPHDQTKISNISIGILRLSETGCLLQALRRDGIASHFECDTSMEVYQITFNSSLILFIVLGGMLLICFGIQFVKKFKKMPQQSARVGGVEMFVVS